MRDLTEYQIVLLIVATEILYMTDNGGLISNHLAHSVLMFVISAHKSDDSQTEHLTLNAYNANSETSRPSSCVQIAQL